MTLLASASLRVSIIKVNGRPAAYGLPGGDETRVLQTDYDNVFGGSMYDSTRLQSDVALTSGVKVGRSYVVFQSFDRSGTCVAAAFNYSGEDHDLTLAEADFGPDSPRGFPLGGRFLTMPHTITYAQLVASLYPRGGPLYGSDAGESWCPGP